jgi:Fe2+ transport system protein FeoA
MINNIWKQKVKDISLDKIQWKHNVCSNSDLIFLSELQCGKSAKVVELKGEPDKINKLEAMGIYVGAVILKKSALLSKGPIIIEKGAMQFALGYDTAKEIIVEAL